VEAAVMEQVKTPGNVAQVATLLALLEESLTGFYSEYQVNSFLLKHDKNLEKLGKEAHMATRRYLERLRSLPDVWSGYWDDQR
jgi:hypothetical protein